MQHAPAATLLFAGSADAYGRSFRAGVAVDETAPLAPMNTYGATKAAADLALGALAAEGLRAVRARPFNHTGQARATASRCRPSRGRSCGSRQAGNPP